jgi:hypothetical protein
LLSSAGGEPLIAKEKKMPGAKKKCLVQKKKCLMLVFAYERLAACSKDGYLFINFFAGWHEALE